MISQPASLQVFSITSACPMPFVPLISSVRTLYVPTTSSPALDLALAAVRIFRAALRILLLRFLLLFQASDFLPSVHFFSQTEHFPFSVSLHLARFLPKCQREGGSRPDSPRPSPFRLSCLITWVRYPLLCSIRAPRFPRRRCDTASAGKAAASKNSAMNYFLCPWLSPPARPYPSASSVHEYGRPHTPSQGLWHVLGKPQARAPPRPGRSRGEHYSSIYAHL